jgi:aryl-alcohol dehydrogenase-like predicted oxidoreductase
MNYRILGKSGLRVSEACFGAMTFGEYPFRGRPFGVDKEKSRALFDTFTGAGGNFIDTANVYGRGLSETYLGEFIHADRDHYVVATKYTITMREGDPNASGSHRKNMRQSVENSLRRLQTDYIDLYYVHFWDWLTPTEELMRGLDDLVRSGKVLYIGISDPPAWRVSQANTLADLRGWSSFIGLQIEYSLIQRTPERELLPMAEAFGLDVLAWGALGGAVLTGKYKQGGAEDSQRRANNEGHGRFSEQNDRIIAAVEKVAAQHGCSNAQVALAWLRAKSPLVIPLIGARTVEQLQDNLGALTLQLDPAAVTLLNEASAISLGFPHDFFERGAPFLYGGTLASTHP